MRNKADEIQFKHSKTKKQTNKPGITKIKDIKIQPNKYWAYHHADEFKMIGYWQWANDDDDGDGDSGSAQELRANQYKNTHTHRHKKKFLHIKITIIIIICANSEWFAIYIRN